MQKKVEENKQDVANSLKEYFKRWPKFYYFIFDFFSPMYFGGLSSEKFLKKYHREGDCYNLGSGARRLNDWVKNVDATSYPEVDVVADITKLPMKDVSVSTIICDQVLEHVENPKKAVSEIYRILKPGGCVYIGIPYMYPFHASPDDYQRWTHEGVKKLFSEFEIVEVGVRSGPFSTLTVYLCYFFATLFSFGSNRLYWLLVYIFGVLLFPVKILDMVGNKLPHAINMSALLYCVIRKKDE